MPTATMIKKIRKEKGLTQKQLGDLCGIADSNIRKYENGKQFPKMETLQKIASALGVSLIELIDEFADPPAGIRFIPDGEEEKKMMRKSYEEATIEATKEAARKRAMDIIKTYKLDDYFLTKSDYIPREWAEIKQYAEYIKSKRNSSDDIMDPNNWETE